MSNDPMSGTASYTGTVTIPPAGSLPKPRNPNPWSKDNRRPATIGDDFTFEGHKYLAVGNVDTHPYGGGAWVRTYDEYGTPVSDETLVERHGVDGAKRANWEASHAVERMYNFYFNLVVFKWNAERNAGEEHPAS
jgi:hypothetical protein